MEIKIIQGVKREVLEDVFVTAIEGGSNYWYFLSDHAIAKIRRAVPKEEDPYLSTAILKAILDHDVKVEINDADDEEEVIGVITRGTMQARLQLLAESELKWALDAHIKEQGDADSADIVFQYITMGEVIYG
jgi:histidinol phosphatase-like PHP family hydrolase